MQRVFVLDSERKPLMPCSPARARELLNNGKSAVYRRFPFTIILKNRVGGVVQKVGLKIDPGSKVTGMAIVNDKEVVFAANLWHRGQRIKKLLDSRREIRRSRRNRKTRYRKAIFLNRTKPEDWLAPSLMSRVHNIETWGSRFKKLAPISNLSMELVGFDMQKMMNPEISGKEYQQGELSGYETREYLLDKFNRTCAYCDAKNVPLEVEHIVPRSRGGTNRISNLTIACVKCNRGKGNMPVEEFLKDDQKRMKRIIAQAKSPLKDAAAVNATRWNLYNRLKDTGLPVEVGSGGLTKFNRVGQGYQKDHWIDAACVGKSGGSVFISPDMNPLQIKAMGHGSRQMCRVDKYGFPRTAAKANKVVNGFQTGDMVTAIVPKGKKAGKHIGRVAVRSSGSFDVKTNIATVQGIGWKYFNKIHAVDGYLYTNTGS